MECEDDSSLCLKFPNDILGQYFLQNDELQDTLPVEPIFTEIDNPVWSYQPLEDSLLSNDNELSLQFKKKEKNSAVACSDLGIPNSNNNDIHLTTDDPNVFTRNRVVLQINKSDDLQEIFQIKSEQKAVEDLKTLNRNSVNVFEISKENSTIILNNITRKKFSLHNIIVKDFFNVIQAHKCKVCSYLCESNNDIMNHIIKEHGDLLEQVVNNDNIKFNNGTSLLNNSINSKTSKTENNVMLYMCGACSKFYWKKDHLIEHMISVHEYVSKITEEIINQKTINNQAQVINEIKPKELKILKQSPKIVVRKQKKERTIRCLHKDGCSIRFSTEQLRQSHERLHISIDGTKAFRCSECNDHFTLWSKCVAHLWHKHNLDLGLFTCPVCNFKSYNQDSMMNHLAIHKDEKPYLCNECGKAFKTNNQLRNHQYIHVKNPSNIGQKTCDKCSQTFSNASALRKHILAIHEKIKLFECNVCERSFSRKDIYQLHIRKHNGEKPYQCNVCEYKSSDPAALRRHKNRHSGKMNYFCHLCNYQSIQITSLKYHMEKKHPKHQEGPLNCPLCSFCSNSSNKYMLHRQMHQKELASENNPI